MKTFIQERRVTRWFRRWAMISRRRKSERTQGKMSIREKKSKQRSSAARGHGISDLANAVGWILCPPDLPISEGWVVVTADDTSSGTMRRINGAETAQNATLQAVFGRSDSALMRLRITPGTCFNIGETQYRVEKLELGALVPRVWVSSSPSGPFVMELQNLLNQPLLLFCQPATEQKGRISSSESSDSDSSACFAPQLHSSTQSVVGEQALCSFLACLQQPTAMAALICASLHLVRDSEVLPLAKEEINASLGEARCRDASGLAGPEATRLLAFAFDEILLRKGVTSTDLFKVEFEQFGGDQSACHEAAMRCLISIVESIRY